MIFQCQKISRDPEDGTILIRQLFQSDVKMKVPTFLINSFLPSGLEAFNKGIAQYLNENMDNFE